MASNFTGPGVVALTWNKAEASEGISHYRVYLYEQIIGNTIDDIGNYIVHNLPLHVLLAFKVVAITNDFRVSKSSNIAYITLPEAGEEPYLNYNLNFNI
jgi:hypothetical protein